MELVRLTGYSLSGPGPGAAFKGIDFVLNRGDRVAIVTRKREYVRLFMRGLATLVYPVAGRFFFKGGELDFSDYRNLLAYKQRVGYTASGVSFISNMSIRDNLMLMANCCEERFSDTLPYNVMALCKSFHLQSCLDMRPAYIDPERIRTSIIVREVSKKPELLLIERPKESLGLDSYETFKALLRSLAAQKVALVFYSIDKDFISEFATRKTLIKDGRLVEMPCT